LGSYRNLFLLLLSVRWKGPSTSFQAFSAPVTGSTIRVDITPPPLPVFLLWEIPEVLPFLVYLLWEVLVMKEWLLLVALRAPLFFAKDKETGSRPQIPFPVRRPDTRYGIPAPSL
jgi:hypothetical protein